jgi:transposase-like protein
MLGFKNFHAAQRTLGGIEVIAMIRKGQLKRSAGKEKTPVKQFYPLTV